MCIKYITNYGCCPIVQILRPESLEPEELKNNPVDDIKVVATGSCNCSKNEIRAQAKAEKRVRKKAYEKRKIDAEAEKQARHLSIELKCISDIKRHECGGSGGCFVQKIVLITDRWCPDCIMIPGRNGKKKILVDNTDCHFPHEGRIILARYRNYNMQNGYLDPESMEPRPRFHGPLSITDLLAAIRIEQSLNGFVTSQIRHGLSTGCLQESRWLLLQIQTVIEDERARLILPPAGFSPKSPEVKIHLSTMLSLLNENFHLRGSSHWFGNGCRRCNHDNDGYLRCDYQEYKIVKGAWAEDFIWERLAGGHPEIVAPKPWWLTMLMESERNLLGRLYTDGSQTST